MSSNAAPMSLEYRSMELRPIVTRSNAVPGTWVMAHTGPRPSAGPSSLVLRASAQRQAQPAFPALPVTAHPREVGLVASLPGGMLAGQEVQVVAVVAGRHGDRVVAAPDQHRVAVTHDDHVVELPGVVVKALQREAALWRDPVVVDLVQVHLHTRDVLVVPVRRVARPVARRRVDL